MAEPEDSGTLRVVRGIPDTVDLAAITAVLYAVARRGTGGAGAPTSPPRAGWSRAHRAPHCPAGSWRSGGS
ncbi:acyl-CoA carboxylase subunit epsilon [Wenjunlia tyrosinilytica]|uniref:acyl-CoA carboxylase subunit epsilon n=1 Tax=Wenjunlia tyrosinilytica TaxID=1544741 RepID=UPI0035710CF6